MPIRDGIRDVVHRYSSREHLNPQETYLIYKDISLTREDIRDVKDGGWLNDNFIAFWGQYLQYEHLVRFHGSAVALLTPAMVHLLKNYPDPRGLREVLPRLEEPVSHVFLPINDSQDRQNPESGSHWSLLIVGISDKVAFHYDSLHSSNFREAMTVVAKFQQLLGFDIYLSDLTDTPQQTNSHDCGVHVCWAMRHLLVRRLLTAERQKEVNMSLGGKHFDAAKMRKEMVKIVEELRKEARRSVSPMARLRGDASSNGWDSPPRIGHD